MKIYRIISIAAILLAAVACVVAPETKFAIDTDKIEIGPEGGERSVNVSSYNNWSVIVQEPWITVSPANGKSSQECKIQIDSALAVTSRTAAVRIENLDTKEYKDITISQSGFDYVISLKDKEVSVAEYAEFGKRSFDVVVNSNVDFDVVIPEESQRWLKYSKSEINLDRGARPRNVTVRFDWTINNIDIERSSEITFVPKKDVQLAKADVLKVVQKAAVSIPENTVKGDSLALVSIGRTLNCWHDWDTTEKLEFWDNVTVWKDGPNKGRVRSARFFLFATKESLPYEVKYLTAAENLEFYSNGNSFLLSLETGDYISQLTQLKRLTIGAYGLTELSDSFKNLVNLEYLDLSSNNFQEIPDILTPENFPKLKSLILNANQRRMIYDLSNTIYKDYGGFEDECYVTDDKTEEPKFPVRMLTWDNLDTLRLSVNYLQGEIPDMKNHPVKWTAEEVHACDTLPEILIGMPKILPNTNFFAINLNRLSGKIPDWLLYHPKLDIWFPYSLVFVQEGKDRRGVSAGFSNEPASLDYYYEHYTNKVYNPANRDE